MNIKFSKHKPAIHRNRHEWELWDLRQEFERLLAQDLVHEVAISYKQPQVYYSACVIAKQRINKLKESD